MYGLVYLPDSGGASFRDWQFDNYMDSLEDRDDERPEDRDYWEEY